MFLHRANGLEIKKEIKKKTTAEETLDFFLLSVFFLHTNDNNDRQFLMN